jgi:hypothetical protein
LRRVRASGRYSVYSLYWYKSTNTDAEGVQLLLARAAQGAASAAILSGGLSLIAETHPPEFRGAAMGTRATVCPRNPAHKLTRSPAARLLRNNTHTHTPHTHTKTHKRARAHTHTHKLKEKCYLQIQFTCFTSTNVQIMTRERLMGTSARAHGCLSRLLTLSHRLSCLLSLSLLPSITVSLAFYLAFYRLLSLSLCLSCLPLSRCLSNSLSSLTLSHTRNSRAPAHTHMNTHTHTHTPRCCIHRSGLTRDTHTHKQTHTHTPRCRIHRSGARRVGWPVNRRPALRKTRTAFDVPPCCCCRLCHCSRADPPVIVP